MQKCKTCKLELPEKKFYNGSKVCFDCQYQDKIDKLKQAQQRKYERMVENFQTKLEHKITRQTTAKINKLKKEIKTGEKQITIAKYLQKTATKFQKYVRMRDADINGICTCITCGVKKHWKECDGGHFMSRKHKVIIMHERNVASQCSYCNRNGYGERLKYKNYLIHTYGWDTVNYLESQKGVLKKWTKEELDEKNTWLDEQIERLKKEKNL